MIIIVRCNAIIIDAVDAKLCLALSQKCCTSGKRMSPSDSMTGIGVRNASNDEVH